MAELMETKESLGTGSGRNSNSPKANKKEVAEEWHSGISYNTKSL